MERLRATYRWALLLLVAWPGPRPVVHSHADYLCQRHNALLLAQHVALFHESSESSGAAHCHWLFTGLAGEAGGVTPSTDVARMTPQACGHDSPPAGPTGWLPSRAVTDPLMRWCAEELLTDWQSRHAVGLAFHQQFCSWIC